MPSLTWSPLMSTTDTSTWSPMTIDSPMRRARPVPRGADREPCGLRGVGARLVVGPERERVDQDEGDLGPREGLEPVERRLGRVEQHPAAQVLESAAGPREA